MKKQVATYFSSSNPSISNKVATGHALGQEWYNTVTGEKFYHKTDGVWISVDTSATALGLIKIVDKDGDFFTDLATAGAYIRTFTGAYITNESFYEGTYWFTVTNGSSFDVISGFLTPSGGQTYAYIEDTLGLIHDFGSNSFEENNGNNILGNVYFQGISFSPSRGNNTLGNCTFNDGAFANSTGINKFKNILLVNSTDLFAEQSTGRFEIYGNIGADETAEYTNFFTASTAVIWAHKSKETSNSGGIEGDLVTAQTNGAKLFFGYLSTEVEDSISDGVIDKAPSQNAVFDALALKLDDPSGIASQYIRGDGTLASFPDIAGGGGGQVYYLNGGISQGVIGSASYYQMSVAANVSTGVDFTSGTSSEVFANFITDTGKPTQETIPAGVWILQCYFSQSESTGTPEVSASVEVYNGATFSLLSSSLVEEITNGTAIDLYTFTVAVPEYTPLTPSDRIAIRFSVGNLSGTNTVTLHTQGPHFSSVQTTFTTGVAALDGLTSAAQYFQTGTTGSDFNIATSGNDTHVFNLPTASATKRGALSSSDWTLFNSKQETLTLTTTGTTGSATLVSNTLNIPQYSGGGATKEIVRMYHALWPFAAAAVNNWFSWGRNSSTMLTQNPGSFASTVSPPNFLADANFLLINGKTKLTKVFWTNRDGTNGSNIQMYIRSFTFANGTGRGSETNSQVLVNETWTTPLPSANGFKNDFTIATHTLDAITGIQIAVRQVTGSPISIQGVNLILEFE